MFTMEDFYVGKTFFNSKGELFKIVNLNTDGTLNAEKLETDTDYQYDLISRDISQPVSEKQDKIFGNYNYPHEEIERMSGY